MKLRNILFDLDGTLVDSARLTGCIIDAMLADRGVAARADRAIIRRMDAVGGEAMISAVMGAHAGDPATELAEFRARHAVIDVPADLAFGGVAETLCALRERGVRLAICSNKPQHLCERILGALTLDRHFDAIIGSRPDLARKPAPDAAFLALEAIGGTVEDTLYCGDSMIDVRTARASNLPVVLVAWGYGTADALLCEPFLPQVREMATLIELVHGDRDLLSLSCGGDPR